MWSLFGYWVLGSSALSFFWSGHPDSIVSSLGVTLVFYAPPILWLLVVLAKRQIRLSQFLGRLPDTRRWLSWSGLTIGLICVSLGASWLVWYPLSFVVPELVHKLLNMPLLFPEEAEAQKWQFVFFQAFMVTIFVPLVEEVIFRGIIMARWAACWGPRVGVILSSLLFGFLHVADPLGATFFGIVMCALYFQTRTLWVPFFCHALNNGIVCILDISWFLYEGSTYTSYSVEEFRQETWWILIALAVGITWGIIYGRRRLLKWPDQLPEWFPFAGAPRKLEAINESPSPPGI